MEKPTNEVIFYIALTNEFHWGRGATIEEALEKAQALTRSKKLKSKTNTNFAGRNSPFQVWLHKNIQTDEDLLSEEMLESFSRSHILLKGYSVGDRLPPFVGCYGNTIYVGELEEIEVPTEFLSRRKAAK